MTPLFCAIYPSSELSEMSLPKITRLPSARLLGSIQHHCQQLLLSPSITPLAVPRRAIQSEYRRPGKPKEDKFPWQKIDFSFSKGLEGIKKNFALLKKEFSDRWVGPEGKPLIEHMLEQTRVIWEFRGPENLEQWVVSSDSEIGGQSEAYLKLSKNNNTLFLYGTLNSTPPRDGETRYSGYCTLRSKQPLVSDITLFFLSEVQVTHIDFCYCSSIQRHWGFFSLEMYGFKQPGRLLFLKTWLKFIFHGWLTTFTAALTVNLQTFCLS